MSDLFALDRAGLRTLEDDARSNPTDFDNLTPTAWQNSGNELGSLLLPAAKIARTTLTAGKAVVEQVQQVSNLTEALATGNPGALKDRTLADDYEREAVQGVGQNAVDFWTPDAASSGWAAKLLGTGAQVSGSLPFILGGPAGQAAFIADSGASPAIDTLQQGGDLQTAATVGGINAGLNAVGFGLPAAFGKQFATRVITGGASNVGLGVAINAGTQETLKDAGLKDYAASWDPLNPQALALDGLMGIAFGVQAHVSAPKVTPTQRAAILTANNADHFTRATLPGEPRTPEAAVMHQDALATRIQQVLNGEPLTDLGVDLSAFDVRPELKPAPEPAGPHYGRAEGVQAQYASLGEQFGFRTTSTTRTAAENEAVGGVATSQHLESNGTARDWSVKGKTPEQVEAFAQALREQGFEVITKTHGTGPHVHAELPKNWRQRARPFQQDAPNFGQAEWPRTIDDADPFWQAIPEGDNGRETVNIDTPEREAMRESLVEEHFAGLEQRIRGDGERPIAYVMGGGGGSGKGTILKLLQAEGEIPTGILTIDPDAIKAGDREHGITGLPEYAVMRDRGDSRAAAVVHEESSQVAARVKARGMAEQRDMVLDRTLGDPVKALAEIRALKAAGYDVQLYGVTLDPAEALDRAAGRAERTMRYVPNRNLLTAHKGFAAGFEQLVAETTKARLYDNGGATPNHIAGAEQGALSIFDQAAYNEVGKRSRINENASTYRGIAEGQADAAPRGNPGADAAGDRGAGAAGAGALGLRDGAGPEAAGPLDPERFPIQGADTTVVTERGLRLPVRYAVVELETLVTSHDNALQVNPDFPAELQPRDRARAASEQQISRIANNLDPELLGASPKAADGAPIVGTDQVVESGNARTIALRRAYASGKGDPYRQWLGDNAAQFELDAAALGGMTSPVLVRVSLGEYDRAEFARQANESTVAGMSATEVALADARMLPDLGGLRTNDDGSINMGGSAKFVAGLVERIGPNERAAMTTGDGQLSQAGASRIRNAVFAKAYGDADLVAMLTEATDANVKNVLAGMLRAAPEIARIREMIAEGGRYGPDLGPDLVAAVRKFSQLRSEGLTVEQFEAQGDFFGEGGLTPKARDLLRTVGENARAPKRFAEFLQRYVDAVEVLGDPRQFNLMDGAKADPVATAAEGTRAANDAPAPKAGSLFNAAGRPTADAAPVVSPENRAAYEAIAAMPDLQILDDAGVLRPAAEVLAEGDAAIVAAQETTRAIDAAANCFIRTAAA